MAEMTPEGLRNRAIVHRKIAGTVSKRFYADLEDRLADALEARDMAQRQVEELKMDIVEWQQHTKPCAIHGPKMWEGPEECFICAANQEHDRAGQAEAERDVLRAEHEANLTILTRLVMDLPMAAGFRGGCENFSEIFDLVVEEHQALRSTLAAVREEGAPIEAYLQDLRKRTTKNEVWAVMHEDLMEVHGRSVRLLALLDAAAPEEQG